MKESDITQKFGVRDLEDIPDEKIGEIQDWVKFQKKKLVQDRASWARKGGQYKASESDWAGYVPDNGYFPTVKGF